MFAVGEFGTADDDDGCFSLLLIGDWSGDERSFSELESEFVLCDVEGDFLDFCLCFARRFLNHTYFFVSREKERINNHKAATHVIS